MTKKREMQILRPLGFFLGAAQGRSVYALLCELNLAAAVEDDDDSAREQRGDC